MTEYWKNLDINDLPGEEWREVHGYDVRCFASNLGRVKREKKCLARKGVSEFQIVKQYPTYRNYLRGAIYQGGIRKYHAIHRIIATAFCENPENKPCVNHVTGQKSLNIPAELEWCTWSENSQHGVDFQLNKGNRKKMIQFDLEGNEIRTWDAAVFAAKEYGISKSAIWMAARGHSKQAAGFKWKYA